MYKFVRITTIENKTFEGEIVSYESPFDSTTGVGAIHMEQNGWIEEFDTDNISSVVEMQEDLHVQY